MKEQKTAHKFHIAADTDTDFLRQVSEQLSRLRKGETRFYIEAETATEFLHKVGEQLPKITFDRIALEALDGLSGKEAFERIEDYAAMTMELACKLFASAVVVDWSEENFDLSAFPPRRLGLCLPRLCIVSNSIFVDMILGVGTPRFPAMKRAGWPNGTRLFTTTPI